MRFVLMLGVLALCACGGGSTTADPPTGPSNPGTPACTPTAGALCFGANK